MTELAELRLVDDTPLEGDPIPLERRTAYRKAADGRVTALVRTSEGGEQRNRICSLELRDMSDTGVGVASQEPLPKGAAITLFFPPHGSERGFDLYGHVVWCRSDDGSHEVGIHLASQQAACA